MTVWERCSLNTKVLFALIINKHCFVISYVVKASKKICFPTKIVRKHYSIAMFFHPNFLISARGFHQNLAFRTDFLWDRKHFAQKYDNENLHFNPRCKYGCGSGSLQDTDLFVGSKSRFS
jgi:hypothetical protein